MFGIRTEDIGAITGKMSSGRLLLSDRQCEQGCPPGITTLCKILRGSLGFNQQAVFQVMGKESESYASTSTMRERRNRILHEARELIGVKGIEGLTMRELAIKSDVALATLYNIYRSKDLLVSYAVNDFFENILEINVKKSLKKSSLDRLLMLLNLIAQHVEESSSYTRVLIALYFKVELDQDIHRVLYKLVHEKFTVVLKDMSKDANYSDWTSLDLIADEITEQVMWRILQWSRGMIPHTHLAEFMKFSVLQILVGATNGEITDLMRGHLKQSTRRLVKVRNGIRAGL